MKHIVKKIILLTAVPAAVLWIHNAYASAGSLDTTFGLCSSTGNQQSLFDYFQTVTVQPDNNIIALGDSSVVGATSSMVTTTLSLSRWNGTNGTLDTSFNSSGSSPGFQTLTVGETTVGNEVTLQPDGKIVVCGYTHQMGKTEFLVARYNTDGTIDTSFNGIGYNTTPIAQGAQANSVQLQSSGKIIVAGTTINQGVPAFALVRYNSDGTFDPTFNAAITSIGFGATLRQIAVLNDNSIIALGYVFDGITTQFAVTKYTPSGMLDGTFGTGGIAITPVGSKAQASSVTVQPDNFIVVAGTSLVNNFARWTLVRYNSSGTPDPTFGTGGVVTSSLLNGSVANSITLQNDGKIIVGGYINGNFGPFFAVGRYTTTGALDSSFGSGGIAQSPGNSSDANSVVIQSNGMIVGGGYIKINGTFYFLIARFFS